MLTKMTYMQSIEHEHTPFLKLLSMTLSCVELMNNIVWFFQACYTLLYQGGTLRFWGLYVLGTPRDVTRASIGGLYSYTHVLPD